MTAPRPPQVDQLWPEDWARFRRVRQQALRTDPAAFAPSAHRWLGDLDVEDAWRERLAAVSTFVAVLDGMDVGTVGMGADHELLGLWVTPAARGSGVGVCLVDALAQHAGPGTPLRLRVMADNDAALRFYTRCGFVLDASELDAEGCVTMTRLR